MEKIAYVVIAVETDDWNCENSDVKAVFLSAKELMEYMEHLTRPSGIAYDLGWHQYDYVIQVVSIGSDKKVLHSGFWSVYFVDDDDDPVLVEEVNYVEKSGYTMSLDRDRGVLKKKVRYLQVYVFSDNKEDAIKIAKDMRQEHLNRCKR